jgi:hypothetical protein
VAQEARHLICTLSIRLINTSTIIRPDGTLLAFEFPNSRISVRRLKRLIGEVPDVSNVKFGQLFGEDPLEFEYRGVPCIVWEPFGDNDHYWVGPSNPDQTKLDISEIQRAVESYYPPLWIGTPGIAAVLIAGVFIYFNWGAVTKCLP